MTRTLPTGLFLRGERLYGKVKEPSGWKQVATGYTEADADKAAKYIRGLQRDLDAREAAGLTDGTVRSYAALWGKEREALGHDWRHDMGRLEHHVLPVIGDLPLADVETRHIVELVRRIRTTPSKQTGEVPAQRTVYNIYGVLAAMFRDARLAGLIAQTPCILTDRQLGPKRDKDPEWRAGAVFTREEVETLISSPLIPIDRRVCYALELLAGVRPGESCALRWRHLDARKQPLGELTVAIAFSTRLYRVKGTKTEAVKNVPVHPVLAEILGEWRAWGWASMMLRQPKPDDLLVPMPPADSASRRTRKNAEPFRASYYSGKKWREVDLPALGWRARRHYDMRATFITLALEDGADRNIIETRVTHTRKSRTAFDGYNRGKQWAITCAEVAKLQIGRGAAVVQGAGSREDADGYWLRRRGSKTRPGLPGDSSYQSPRREPAGAITHAGTGEPATAPRHGAVLSACDLGLAALLAEVEHRESLLRSGGLALVRRRGEAKRG